MFSRSLLVPGGPLRARLLRGLHASTSAKHGLAQTFLYLCCYMLMTNVRYQACPQRQDLLVHTLS